MIGENGNELFLEILVGSGGLESLERVWGRTWGNLFNKILIKAFLQLQFNPCLARIFLIWKK